VLLFADRHPQPIAAGLATLDTAPQAARYHLNAKFSRRELALADPDLLTKPERSEGGDTLDGLPRIPVPSSPDSLRMPLMNAIESRRSQRRFADAPISSTELGTLLRFGAGIVSGDGTGETGRAIPSGGGKYPVQLVACARTVDGIPPAIYGYDVPASSLVPLRTGTECCRAVQAASFTPTMVENAAVILLLVGILNRSTRKYGERGYRLAVQEAGHIAQNLTLVATALGLGSIVMAGFDEHDIERLLDLDGETETLLSSVVVGRCPGGTAQEGGPDHVGR
jgi:SagB-type dehydrogenase family enzyme